MRTSSNKPLTVSSRAPVVKDPPTQGQVIARLTLTRASGYRTIVEIRSDANFHNFYRFYKQQGARRSTKQLIRIASRIEGLLGNHTLRPGLELIAKRNQEFATQTNPVLWTKLRIIKKRLYRKLISADPEPLAFRTQVRIPVAPIWVPVRAHMTTTEVM